jgi:predicted ATP-grasp superfamily ATP-dependent carboligase
MIAFDLMILDGETRTTLGIVRSFVRRGISIIVGCSKTSEWAAFSRGIKHHFTYRPIGHLEQAHKIIKDHVKHYRPKVLMPVMNWGWSIVYNFYDEYEHLTKIVPNPGKKLFNRIFDKGYLADKCEDYGIPTPKTIKPENINEALALRDQLTYPVLLKPKRSEGGIGIKRVDNRHKLEKTLREYSSMPVIQDFIEGEDLELTILCVNGQPIAGHAYKSLRNDPLPYGPPVACRTIRDEALMNLGANFLKKIHYNGVAHLDFRRDRRDCQAKLLDFNPRLAGTNDASINSGIDFAYLLYKMALNQPVNPIFDYEVGNEYRWISGELGHLLHAQHKYKTLRKLIRLKHVSTDFSFMDFKPHLIWFGRKLKQTVKKYI